MPRLVSAAAFIAKSGVSHSVQPTTANSKGKRLLDVGLVHSLMDMKIHLITHIGLAVPDQQGSERVLAYV